MSTTNLLFVPVVEEFEELPTDLVLYAPVTGTPRQIVEHFQNAMGTKPWPWKAGGWNNLSEALQEATVLRPGRLVIKVQRLPRRLKPEELRIYLEILADVAQGQIFQYPPAVVVFPEKDRHEVLHFLEQP
jgi:hypothetical protein